VGPHPLMTLVNPPGKPNARVASLPTYMLRSPFTADGNTSGRTWAFVFTKSSGVIPVCAGEYEYGEFTLVKH
jgi:hypothetical protein